MLPEFVEETPKGEKKILKSLEDPHRTAYIPKVVESAWYDWWEKEGFFTPEFSTPTLKEGKVNDKGTFVMYDLLKRESCFDSNDLPSPVPFPLQT